MRSAESLVVIGASAGGVEAIQKLLASLPMTLQVPIVVVMHLPEHSEIHFERIMMAPGYQILEGQDKMPIEKKRVIFAPPGYHLLIEKNHTLSLSQDEVVHYSRPSIDVLFESAAKAFGRRLIGILLTGANRDGAEGMLQIHRMGGKTIVQDPKSAQVSAMPAAALALFQPDQVLHLDQIQDFFRELEREDLSWKI